MNKKADIAEGSGYITHACSNCQKRHAKCGDAIQGERPACFQCSSKELDCRYLSSAKRGPKKKDARKNTNTKKTKRREVQSKKPAVLKEIIAVARDRAIKSESKSVQDSYTDIVGRIRAKSSLSEEDNVDDSSSENEQESTSASKDSVDLTVQASPHSTDNTSNSHNPHSSPDTSTENYDAEIQDLMSNCVSSFSGYMARPASREKGVIAALRFLGDSGRIIPNAFELDIQRLGNYWQLSSVEPVSCGREVDDMGLNGAEALLFSAVMAHGFRSSNFEELSRSFMARSEGVFDYLARKTHLHVDRQSANSLCSALILMAVFQGASRNLDLCAKYFKASHDIASTYKDWVSPSLQYRSFSAMLGMSKNPRDRYTWFTNAKMIAQEGHTLANKTVLAFMWICPPLVVGENNIYLSAAHARTSVENVLILAFLDEIEADLLATSRRQQVVDDSDTIDYIATFWTVARALRVITYARMNSSLPTIVSTVSSMLDMFCILKQGRQLTRVPFLPLTVSYALSVIKDHDVKLWKYGVSLLSHYGSRVPAISSAPELSQQLVNITAAHKEAPTARPEALPQRSYISYRTLEEQTAQKGFADIDIFGSAKK